MLHLRRQFFQPGALLAVSQFPIKGLCRQADMFRLASPMRHLLTSGSQRT